MLLKIVVCTFVNVLWKIIAVSPFVNIWLWSFGDIKVSTYAPVFILEATSNTHLTSSIYMILINFAAAAEVTVHGCCSSLNETAPHHLGVTGSQPPDMITARTYRARIYSQTMQNEAVRELSYQCIHKNLTLFMHLFPSSWKQQNSLWMVNIQTLFCNSKISGQNANSLLQLPWMQ